MSHPAPPSRRKLHLRLPPPVRAALSPLLTLALFGGAIWVVDHLLTAYHWRDVSGALTAIPMADTGLALLLVVLGYLSLVAYDWLAFRFAGRPLPWRTMLLPSLITFAVSNTAPASAFTAGGVRYRMYAPLGFTLAEAAVVAGFNIVTYAVGLCALAGLILLVHPLTALGGLAWLRLSARSVGLLLVLVVTAYGFVTWRHRASVTFFGRRLRLPTFEVALRQIGISAADWLFSSGALYVLVASVTPVHYLDFLATFFIGQTAALLLPLPGGIGIFEAVVLLVRPAGTPAPRVLAALLLYRVLYYLLPLLAAGVLIAWQEVQRLRGRERPLAALLDWLGDVVPHVFSFITFLAGELLLLTGAIPTDQRRLAWLANLLPLSVIEASHFLASVVGAMLLILAWGLEQRVRLAYRLTQLLFAAGIVLALARSVDVGVALSLVGALALVHAAGSEFQRPVSLLREPLSAGWRIAIGAALAVTLWLGRFAYRHVDWTAEPWWRFALSGDAPRFLRAAVGMGVVVLLFAFARLLVPVWPSHLPHLPHLPHRPKKSQAPLPPSGPTTPPTPPAPSASGDGEPRGE